MHTCPGPEEGPRPRCEGRAEAAPAPVWRRVAAGRRPGGGAGGGGGAGLEAGRGRGRAAAAAPGAAPQPAQETARPARPRPRQARQLRAEAGPGAGQGPGQGRGVRLLRVRRPGQLHVLGLQGVALLQHGVPGELQTMQT